MSFTMSADLATLATVNLVVGCKCGEMQLKLVTDPVVKLDFTARTGEVKLSETSTGTLVPQGPGTFISNGPNSEYAPPKYAMRALNYLKREEPDLVKFQYEMQKLAIHNKILCHLDFIYVNLEIGMETFGVKNDPQFSKWLDLYKKDT